MSIPGQFCWTKFGSEAGEGVEAILARKLIQENFGGIINGEGTVPAFARQRPRRRVSQGGARQHG